MVVNQVLFERLGVEKKLFIANETPVSDFDQDLGGEMLVVVVLGHLVLGEDVPL